MGIEVTEEGCQHERQELRRRVVANGAVQFVRQCLNCGRSENKPVAHSLVHNAHKVAPFDESLIEAYREARDALWKNKRAAEKSEFDQWYGEYLRTDAWKKKRAAVLRRCGGVCEGCGEAKADSVHHLTYEHVGNELLFELVGVCRECHERAHEKNGAGD